MFETLAVCFDCQLEIAYPIFGERVGSALENYYIRTIRAHDYIGYFVENVEITRIVHSLFKRHIHTIIPSQSLSNWLNFAGAGEKFLLVLVKAQRHNSVGMIESLLDAISVMHIYINVEDPRVDLQQLNNAHNNIVNIAEPTR